MSGGLLRRLAVTAASAATAAAIASQPALGSGPAAQSAQTITPPSLDVRAAALLEESTGQALYGQAGGVPMPIASTTKLMTALVTLEHVRNLRTVFTQGDYYPAPAESQIGLVPGERMTVHDLLLALLLPSANDAAEDLALNIGHGSVARFVAMMNVRARELGLASTHYATPVGLDASDNYSCAWDLVRLARYLLTHYSFFARAVSLPSAVLHSGNHPRDIVNRNDLVGRVWWIRGVKTGHTLDAGWVLVGAGSRGGMTLISAVLGTTSESARDANTLALLGWGFANFRLMAPVRAGTVIARPAVSGRPRLRAVALASRTFVHVFARSAAPRLRLRLPSVLTGPLARGATVGSVLVLAGGRTVGSIPLVLARSIPAPPPAPMKDRFPTSFTLVSLAVLLLVALAVASGLRSRRSRGAGAAGSKPR